MARGRRLFQNHTAYQTSSHGRPPGRRETRPHRPQRLRSSAAGPRRARRLSGPAGIVSGKALVWRLACIDFKSEPHIVCMCINLQDRNPENYTHGRTITQDAHLPRERMEVQRGVCLRGGSDLQRHRVLVRVLVLFDTPETTDRLQWIRSLPPETRLASVSMRRG